MTRLALAAVLLMAFAPSISRVLAGSGAQGLAGWSELCTTQGLKWVDTAAQSAAAKSKLPDAPAMGGDCAYCPLAASLPVWLPLILEFPHPMAGEVIPLAPPPRFATANLRGLGGRGPPILL